MSPQYENHFSVDGKRCNPAIKQLEKKEEKRRILSPNKKDTLNLKEKFILEEENRLEDPLT